jgi:hypothetical protein
MSGNTWWSLEEEQHLRDAHASAIPYKSVMHFWPGRTHNAVIDKAAHMKLGARPVPLKHNYSACWEGILRELENGGATSRKLSEIVGMCWENAGRLLRKNLNGDDPKIHVAHWVRSRPGGPWVEFWELGNGENAERPKPMTNQQMKAQRRAIERVKAGRANPFAHLTGEVSVPHGKPGRVYIHMTDSLHDDMAEVA